jgi:hypothetical protein
VSEAVEELELTIATPGDWIVLEHDALADDGAIEALVRDRLDEVPELAPYREALASTVAKTAARAQAEGVVFSALLADPGLRGAPVMANLVVATSAEPAPELAAEAVPAQDSRAQDDLGAIERALDARDPAAVPGEDGVAQRAVHSVLLPGGPALRVARLMEFELVPGGPALLVLSVEYFFTATDLEQVFVLRFTSPSVAAHEELQLVFHRIARTFRVARER